jgi:hypothetical protein
MSGSKPGGTSASQKHNSEHSFNYLTISPGISTIYQRYVYRETGFVITNDATRVFHW